MSNGASYTLGARLSFARFLPSLIARPRACRSADAQNRFFASEILRRRSASESAALIAADLRAFASGLRHARRVINVRLAGPEEREHLHCRSGEPLFEVEKTVFDDTGTPLQRSLLLTPSNRVNFVIQV